MNIALKIRSHQDGIYTYKKEKPGEFPGSPRNRLTLAALGDAT